MLLKDKSIKSLGDYVESYTGISKNTFYKWKSLKGDIPSEKNLIRFLALVNNLDREKAKELKRLYYQEPSEKAFIYDCIIPDKTLDVFEKELIISYLLG